MEKYLENQQLPREMKLFDEEPTGHRYGGTQNWLTIHLFIWFFLITSGVHKLHFEIYCILHASIVVTNSSEMISEYDTLAENEDILDFGADYLLVTRQEQDNGR